MKLALVEFRADIPDKSICKGRAPHISQFCGALLTIRHAELDERTCDSLCRSLRAVPRGNTLSELQADTRFARSDLNLVTRSKPDWAPGYYGLARVAARGGDFKRALELLIKARPMAGMSRGIIDFEIARVHQRALHPDSAWLALRSASQDSSQLASAVIAAGLSPYMSDSLLGEWQLSGAARDEWMRATPAFRRLFEVGLSAPAFYAQTVARIRAYSETIEQGTGLLLSFGITGIKESQSVTIEDSMSLTIHAVRESDGREFSLDTLRRFRVLSGPSAGRQDITSSVLGGTGRMMGGSAASIRLSVDAPKWLSGYQTMALPPGIYTISVRFVRPGGGRISGSQTLLRGVRIGSVSGVLSMSDLIVGRAESGSRWQSEENVVPLNPFGTWASPSDVSLFSQLHGLIKDDPFSVTLDLREVGKSGEESQRTATTMLLKELAVAENVEWFRIVRLPELKPGEYVVRVTVQQDGRVVTSEDRITIVR